MKIVLKSILVIFIVAILGFIIITIIALSGYGTVSFDDVSSVKPYSEVMGSIVTSKKELILHGWTEEDFTVKNPIFYSFSLPPGTDNRFVKSRSTVPAGLKLEIVAVEKCKNCYLDFGQRIKFKVKLQNLKTDHELPVYLDDSFLIQDWGNNKERITYDYTVFESDS